MSFSSSLGFPLLGRRRSNSLNEVVVDNLTSKTITMPPTLSEQVKAKENDLEHKKSEFMNAEFSIHKFEDEKKNLEKDIKLLKTELTNLPKRLEVLRAVSESLNSQISEKKVERVKYDENIQIVENSLKNIKDISPVKEKNEKNRLINLLKIYKAKLNELNNEIENLENQFKINELEIEKLGQDLVSKNATLIAKEQKFNNDYSDAKLNDLKQERNSKKEEFSIIETELNLLKLELAEENKLQSEKFELGLSTFANLTDAFATASITFLNGMHEYDYAYIADKYARAIFLGTAGFGVLNKFKKFQNSNVSNIEGATMLATTALVVAGSLLNSGCVTSSYTVLPSLVLSGINFIRLGEKLYDFGTHISHISKIQNNSILDPVLKCKLTQDELFGLGRSSLHLIATGIPFANEMELITQGNQFDYGLVGQIIGYASTVLLAAEAFYNGTLLYNFKKEEHSI